MPGRFQVASVSARVVPDARGFKRELKTQLGELTVDVNANLRDEAIKARLDKLTRDRDVNIRVKAETTAASTKLREAARDRTATVHARIDDRGTRQFDRRMRNILSAVFALGPALIPVAATTVALAGNLAGMGVAGILAFKGIQNEIANGTRAGRQFQAGITLMQNDLHRLEATAAGHMLGPFEEAVATIHRNMPNLNSEVGLFATQLGNIGGDVLQGVLTAFHRMVPLMATVGQWLDRIAKSFAGWASGNGFQSFLDYAAATLPEVTTALGAVGRAIITILRAFAPWGSTVLHALTAFSDLVNALPIGALQTFATAVGASLVAMQGMRIAGAVANKVNLLARAFGTAEISASAMKIAIGGVGAVLGIATFLWAQHVQSVEQNKQATQEFTDALIASNGAMDESITKIATKQLMDSVSARDLDNLRLSQQTLTQAALGYAPAIKTVNDHVAKYGMVTHVATRAQLEMGTGQRVLSDGAKKVRDGLAAVNGRLNDGKAAQKRYASGMKGIADSTGRVDVATRRMAHSLGVSVPTLQAVRAAQKQQASATQQATVKMQLENDAAGLLKASLDALSGKSLSYAQSLNGFQDSLVNMGDHVTSTGKKIKFTTTSINNMSSASVALRGQLLQQVQGAEQSAEAYGEMRKSSEAGRLKLIALRKQIINNAVAHGVDRKAVVAYIDKVLQIPKKVPPTKVDIDKREADRKRSAFEHEIRDLPKYHKTDITVPGATLSAEQAQHVHREITQIPGHKYSPIRTPGAVTAAGQARNVHREIAQIHGKTVHIGVTGAGAAVYAAQSVQSAINALHSRHVTITTSHVNAFNKIAAIGAIGAGFGGAATGGYVRGPGTTTSDSFLMALSDREFVVNARQTEMWRPVLEAINAGMRPRGFADGGFTGSAVRPAVSASVTPFAPQYNLDVTNVGRPLTGRDIVTAFRQQESLTGVRR